MKTLIAYDTKGKIIFSISGTGIEDNCKCLVTNIEEDKEPIYIDVETNKVITKDKDTRREDIKSYLDNADNNTVSKVENTILEAEKIKTLNENGGM